jgi:hypothetical protein
VVHSICARVVLPVNEERKSKKEKKGENNEMACWAVINCNHPYRHYLSVAMTLTQSLVITQICTQASCLHFFVYEYQDVMDWLDLAASMGGSAHCGGDT